MANQYTKLIIDNQEIDLFEAETLPLNVTKRVNTFDGKVAGDFSRASVTVPATKNNINILGMTRQFYSFRIEVDGAPSFNGTARVRKNKTYSPAYGAIQETYEINLISNNASWFVLLGDTLLSELTTEVVPYNAVSVFSGFIGDPTVNDWAFCLIKWKEWGSFAFGKTYYAPSIFESTPALYIKPLLIEAFDSIGYTLLSDFLDSDLGSKLILPVQIPDKFPVAYNEEYLNTEVSQSGTPFTFPIAVTAGNYPFDVIDVAAPQNPTAYDNVLFQYTAPLRGYYEVSIEFEFGAVAPAAPFVWFIALEVNNVDIVPRIGFAFSSAGSGPQYPTAGTILKATGVVFLDVGDIVNYRYTTSGGITVNSAKCTITGEAVLAPNVPIDFKYLLRDWKLLDMLQGMICMFNFAFETNDSSRIVRMEPKDGYLDKDRFAGTSVFVEGFYQNATKDYSQLIDYEKEGSFEYPEIAGRFDFLYAADTEETIEFIEDINEFKIYEARYPMASGSDNSKQEEKEVPFFVKSIHVLDVETKPDDSNITPQFPLIYPQNYLLDPTATEADMDASPRIFYHAGQRVGFEEIDGEIEILEFPGTLQKLPLTFMVNYQDDSGLDPNLGFDTQVLNGVTSIGLLENYWLQELARKDRGYLRNNYAPFDSIAELNFSFRTKAFIDSGRFVVQQIKGINQITNPPPEFQFLKDVFPDSDDVDNIRNSDLRGVVSFLGS